MLVYRITSKKYAENISGMGAALRGGRWNKKGTPVLYTGESKEIALLETLVNITPMLAPSMVLLTLEIPNKSVTSLNINDLPNGWMNYPYPTVLSEIAENWVKKMETIALKVPSSIIDSSHNYILNCSHPNYSEVKIIEMKDFYFDPRLKK